MENVQMQQCHFCNYDLTSFKGQKYKPSSTFYHCPICGEIRLKEEADDDFEGERFSENQKKILSIVLRNEYERRNKKPPETPTTLDDLNRYIGEYRPLSPLEKLDYCLLIIEKATEFIGSTLQIYPEFHYPLFHCLDPIELKHILAFLLNNRFISPFKGYDRENYTQYDIDQISHFFIDQKGFERLRELQGVDSNVGFVAMWFNPEMLTVYEQAIQPAIEYIEEGASEPRFRAVRVDNVEHVNDINDEIVAQIRRSRFMVSDLTGYRGGVYFEAGFAYGLGMPVIYTCRKDWCDEDQLKDDAGKIVEFLKDSKNRPVQVRKEGVHFDLAHRNRIEWEIDKLDEFKVKLENRIKAVIV
jgi:nucleoside 2-deoxyribosyltransferase